jgi:hypothetical protein
MPQLSALLSYKLKAGFANTLRFTLTGSFLAA